MKRYLNEKTTNTIETEDVMTTIKDIELAGGKVAKTLAEMDFGSDEVMRWCYCQDQDSTSLA